MKILYAIQGTGNGHMARAREIIPHLESFCEFDILVGGDQHQLSPGHPVTFHCKSLTLIYDNQGSLSLRKTLAKNNFVRFFNEVRKLPVDNYDLVISDFEPTSAWACRLKNVPCVAVSHQAAFQSDKVPRPPRKSISGEFLLRHFAPAIRKYGFHFLNYDDNIYSPLIRTEVKNLEPEDGEHYTVYLPAFSLEKTLGYLKGLESATWQIFSNETDRQQTFGNATVFPVDNDSFLESLRTCKGVLCSAGFETPSEALYLGKKLLVIPIGRQYEQQCNAAALQKLGVEVVENIHSTEAKLTMDHWLKSEATVPLPFHRELPRLIHKIFLDHISCDLKRSTELNWNFNLF